MSLLLHSFSLTFFLGHGLAVNFASLGQIKVEPWPDHRSFSKIETFCDFNNTCRIGSVRSEWELVTGQINRGSFRDVAEIPNLPAIGVESSGLTTEKISLYTDIIPCERGGKFSFKMWIAGSWSLQICFLKPATGGTHSCTMNKLSNSRRMQYSKIDQLLPRLCQVSKGCIVAIEIWLQRGFVLVDDLSLTSRDRPCSERKESPYVKWSDENYAIELFAPLLRNQAEFVKYLADIRVHPGAPVGKFSKIVCIDIECRFSCQWGKYNLTGGIVDWTVESSEYPHTWLVSNFHLDEAGFSVLSSPLIHSVSGPKGYNRPFLLSFDYEIHEELRLLLCLYVNTTKSENRAFCSELDENPKSGSLQTYTSLIQVPTVQFEIIAYRTTPNIGSLIGLSTAIITNVRTEGCGLIAQEMAHAQQMPFIDY